MPHIAPICLPSKGEDFLGQFGWAAGWGALQPGRVWKKFNIKNFQTDLNISLYLVSRTVSPI